MYSGLCIFSLSFSVILLNQLNALHISNMEHLISFELCEKSFFYYATYAPPPRICVCMYTVLLLIIIEHNVYM